MTEVDAITVEHDVLLALQPKLAVLTTRRERAARDQMLVADDFRPDEAAGDVGVDLARGQHRGFV